MSIKRMNAESGMMDRNIKFVKVMTKGLIPDGDDTDINWNSKRERYNFFYYLMPKANGAKYSNTKLGNTKALEVVYPEKKLRTDVVFVYTHGGGFLVGNGLLTKSFCSMIAKESACRVYSLEFPLAPEHQYPDAFNVCCEAVEEVFKKHAGAKVVLIGDSSGGNLALALGLKYKDTRRLAGVIVHSPIIDISGALDHTKNENNDFLITRDFDEVTRHLYVGDADVKDPFISPYYGDFTGFPPTYITCDVNETLYEDSSVLYEKCKEAGVEVEMVQMSGAFHAFGVSGAFTPETEGILRDSIGFVLR